LFKKRNGNKTKFNFNRSNGLKVIPGKMKQKKYKLIYLACLLVAFTSVFATSEKATASQITSQKITELVNESREQEGFRDLKTNEILNGIAQAKLNDMVENKYFAHTSPNGLTPWYWFEKNNYDYKYAGENLAMNFSTAESQHKAWMDSPTHKKNIMNPLFLEIGVAVGAGEINGKTVLLSVQEFGTLAAAADNANNPDNFSGSKKANKIEQEMDKPMVLSSKDSFENKDLEFNKPNAEQRELIHLGDNFGDSQAFVSDMFEKLAILFMLAALMAIPLSFVIASFHKSRMTAKQKNLSAKPIPIKFLDNIHKSTKVRVHLI
jgi:uncharacterized protein YkwD